VTYIKVMAVIILIAMVVSKFIPAKGVKQITGEQLKGKLKNKNIQYIDVRTPREYNQAHVEGFKNIPLKRIRRHYNDLDKDKETIVICHTGIRSMDACKRFKRYGFTNLTNVKNGLRDFQ